MYNYYPPFLATLASSMLDLLERALSPVTEDLLASAAKPSNVGQYKAVELPPELFSKGSKVQKVQKKAKVGRELKKNVKGRAGGGWESDEREEDVVQDTLQLLQE